MMEHEQATQQQGNSATSIFRDGVALAIVFGGSPALFLSFLFWAGATVFPQMEPLASIIALLMTSLLSSLGIILVICHADRCLRSMRKCRAFTLDKWLMTSIGAGIVCLFLVATIVLCLSMADMLEGWYYTLIAAESVIVGYQISVM